MCLSHNQNFVAVKKIVTIFILAILGLQVSGISGIFHDEYSISIHADGDLCKKDEKKKDLIEYIVADPSGLTSAPANETSALNAVRILTSPFIRIPATPPDQSLS